MATATATPTKLRSGDWGARVTGSVKIGEVVTIETKSGKRWDARVVRVVWTDGKVSLCATESLEPKPGARTWDPDAFNGRGRARGGMRRSCRSDGNCSSIGSGKSCGGHDCDGW